MKVKFIGFGGGFMEYPCYEDENEKIYFDMNNGRGTILLYTGAYRHPEDGDICGEPYSEVLEQVECDEPFKRHLREFDYQLLGRYKSDCDYFLGYGNGYEGHLYFKDVTTHCDEMKKLYDSFSDEDKPLWITSEQIEDYRLKMLKRKEEVKS